MSGFADLGLATDQSRFGGKAATLGRLARRGILTPPGLVLAADDDGIDAFAVAACSRFGSGALAVRSSGITPDLSAGRFLSVLSVSPDDVAAAARAVRADAATKGTALMAVIAMPMLEPSASGIAFSRNPITGADECLISAVAGLSADLTAGRVSGEEWVVADRAARAAGGPVLAISQVEEVARLTREVASLEGSPQNVEWAITPDGLYVLQARPVA